MSTLFRDIRNMLLKRDFPFCARDALTKSEELLSSISSSRNQKEMEVMGFISRIISEFVFFEHPDCRGVSRELSSYEELELALVVCDHMTLDTAGSGAVRNTLFLSLFDSPHDWDPHRFRLLLTLTSVALSVSCHPVLAAAAVLFQQVGSTSSYSKEFALSLVNEFFLLVDVGSPVVVDLPRVSPLFVANFLTALCNLYTFRVGVEIKEPPKELLEVVVKWLSNKTVCFSPLAEKQPLLTQGGIPKPPVTPFAGLFRWSLGSCLLSNSDPLYLTLESLLLDSLRESVHVVDVTSPILNAPDVASMVPLALNSPDSGSTTHRLAVIVHTAIETKNLTGHKHEFLRNHLSMLPRNKLLDSILERDLGFL